MNKVIFGGFVMGALAAGVFHQGTLFLLFHQGHLWPALLEAVGRPPFPGWDLLRDVPGRDVPLLAAQAAVGGLWGILLAALLRWTPVPDLLGGALLGVVAGAAVPSVLDQGPEVARAALAGAGFGWGCALLLRVVEIKPLGALRMRHQWAPRD
ncbi:hypothetical protein ACI6QG_15030 [Roseococcus sp. DSY-14]|uniref:hypothetical protein n=1 Tax=Roseococcus sp. DSY-14 TaxID=3369650 RepID=UPI00387B3073